MIDTDKMKAAFAATPLCQNKWTEKDGDQPTKLCALSSLVSFAGVQPDLIAKMNATETHQKVVPLAGSMWGRISVPMWVATLALPVLRAEYGIPENLATHFPSIFDKQENEWRGVEEVLALCEKHNMDEMHADAIREDDSRFPKALTASDIIVYADAFGSSYTKQLTWSGQVVGGKNWLTATFEPETNTEKPKKPAKSKYWTAPPKNYNPPPKFLTTV